MISAAVIGVPASQKNDVVKKDMPMYRLCVSGCYVPSSRLRTQPGSGTGRKMLQRHCTRRRRHLGSDRSFSQHAEATQEDGDAARPRVLAPDSPLLTPYSASKTSTPVTSRARVQQKSIIAEVTADVAWTLMNPTHCAARRGVIRPKADEPLMIAKLVSG